MYVFQVKCYIAHGHYSNAHSSGYAFSTFVLHCKEIQLVHSKGDQSWVFFGRNDAKTETPVLWPPHAKS